MNTPRRQGKRLHIVITMTVTRTEVLGRLLEASDGFRGGRPKAHVAFQELNQPAKDPSRLQGVYLALDTTNDEDLAARDDPFELGPGRVEFAHVCEFRVDVDDVGA